MQRVNDKNADSVKAKCFVQISFCKFTSDIDQITEYKIH